MKEITLSSGNKIQVETYEKVGNEIIVISQVNKMSIQQANKNLDNLKNELNRVNDKKSELEQKIAELKSVLGV